MLKSLAKRYIAAFASKDLHLIETLMADEFVLEDPVIKRVEGKSLALEAINKIFKGCTRLDFFAKNIFEDENVTCIEFVLLLDDLRLEGVDVINWRNGKMVELRAYLDIPKV